jgi:nucleotide-binding universal stress UspA family protein
VGVPAAFEQRVVTGAPSAELVHAAREDDADLVVVGRPEHAASPLGFVGTTCGRLVQAAPCAVLTVPRAVPVAAARLSA